MICGYFETLVCHLLHLPIFWIKSLFFASTPRLQFIGLSCGKQSKLGLRNRASCWEWRIIDMSFQGWATILSFPSYLNLEKVPPQVLPKYMPPVNLLPKFEPQEFLMTGDRQMSWEVWLEAGVLGKCPLTASLAWACFTCPLCLFISIWSEGKCTEWQKQPWKHISGADWKSNESLYIYNIAGQWKNSKRWRGVFLPSKENIYHPFIYHYS